MKNINSILIAAKTRIEKARTSMEYDSKELQSFASAFGLSGKPREGGGEKVTNDWYLMVNPKDVQSII